MSEDLDGWLGPCFHATGHAELGADVVGAGRGMVALERGVGEISTLLGNVLSEGGGVHIGLGDGDIEDASAGRDCDWDGEIGASFGSCGGRK